MSRGYYCLSCGERWTFDADRHQLSCEARDALLARDTERASSWRTSSMDEAPVPARFGARGSTRPSRAFRCAACGLPWSTYPSNHERGCEAATLLARGQREEAKRRWRIRPGGVPRPEAVPKLADRFRAIAGGRR